VEEEQTVQSPERSHGLVGEITTNRLDLAEHFGYGRLRLLFVGSAFLEELSEVFQADGVLRVVD